MLTRCSLLIADRHMERRGIASRQVELETTVVSLDRDARAVEQRGVATGRPEVVDSDVAQSRAGNVRHGRDAARSTVDAEMRVTRRQCERVARPGCGRVDLLRCPGHPCL